MGKYDLGLARRIIEGSAKFTEKQEVKALAEVSARRAERLSPAATAANNDAHAVLKSQDNVRKMDVATKESELAKAKNIAEEEVPRSLFEAPTKRQYEGYQKVRRDDAFKNAADSQDAEKLSRAPSSAANENTVVSSDRLKVAALAPAGAIGLGTSGFSNPLDVLKHGYDKFETVRQGVIDKVMDLTGDVVTSNPHVPQYAKDIYNKGADAILSTATNPLNYVGGAGAVDATIGAAGAAYDMYSAPKPVTTYADRNPVQQFKVKP